MSALSVSPQSDPYADVLATIDFDDSQMFDLLRAVAAQFIDIAALQADPRQASELEKTSESGKGRRVTRC